MGSIGYGRAVLHVVRMHLTLPLPLTGPPSPLHFHTKAFSCYNVFMRTTIDVPDDLMRRAKATAAMNGLKLKDLVARYIERGLQEGFSSSNGSELRPKRYLPAAVRQGTGTPIPYLSNAELYAILDEEDAASG